MSTTAERHADDHSDRVIQPQDAALISQLVGVVGVAGG
jgi:hypothetical protein